MQLADGEFLLESSTDICIVKAGVCCVFHIRVCPERSIFPATVERESCNMWIQVALAEEESYYDFTAGIKLESMAKARGRCRYMKNP